MKCSIKIMLGVGLGLVVVLGIALVANGDLLEGRLFLISKPLPAYDETGVKRPKREDKVLPAYNETEYKSKNALDTLVIVNTDVYGSVNGESITNTFKIAEDNWLIPKTGIKFNVNKIEYFSFKEKCPQYGGICDEHKMLYNYFHEENNPFPEFVVIFDNAGVAGINGGYGWKFTIHWVDPSSGEFYEPNSAQKYCNEFNIPYYPYDIPIATIDYTHKFQGDKNSFYGQSQSNFIASEIFHELLHPYADDEIEYEHFTTLCIYVKLGWSVDYTWDYYDVTNVNDPFTSLSEEYASMCPYVWQQFINSQQVCP